MGRAPKVVGNPEWVEILEAWKEKAEIKDPNSGILFSYGKAIKSLKECSVQQSEPGEIKLKFIGKGIVDTLKKELRKPRHHRPVKGYDSLQSSSGPSSDPATGKGKAREYHPRVDERLHALAGIFGNPAFAGQRQEDSAPKQPSREAMGKAAAVEEAILVGLYTQCHETSQKTWKSEKELLMLAEPWMTHHTTVLGPRLIALTSRKHLDCHMRDNIPVYSFTWEGYCSAQDSAAQKGLPAINIVQNDLVAPSVPQVAPTTKVARKRAAVTMHSTIMSPEELVAKLRGSEQGNAIPRPQGIVSVNRDAPALGNFATIVPRKRPASAVEETYQGLSQYTRAAADEASDAQPAPAVTHKPVNKRFAAPTIASVFQDKTVIAPVTHSDVLAFLFTYLDENDNRVATPAEADLKPHPEKGTQMYKVEYRARQARHPLARIIHDKKAMARTPPDAEGLTECGWIAAEKAPLKCPGIGSLKPAARASTIDANVPAPPKKQSKSAAIASLMGGSAQPKKNDTRAMYKFPSLDTYDWDKPSSPEKPKASVEKAKPSNTSLPRTTNIHANASNADLINTIFGTARTEPQASGSGTTGSRHAPAPSSARLSASSSSSPCKHLAAPVARELVIPASGTVPHVPKANVAAVPDRPRIPAPIPAQRPTENGGYLTSYSWAMEDHLTFPSFQPIVLAPGTFDVILQIDHREVKDVSLSTLERAFSRKNITYEVVNLVLGDYLWVARRKQPLGDGYDEVILAICERKRKDDFIDSIKDDRHIDQKRRIKAAGVTRCLYLVEEFDTRDDEYHETFMKAIQTSINQTLLMDGFSLHVANSHHETLAHLGRVTRVLEQEMQRLNVIPDARVDHGHIAALQRHLESSEPETTYHISRKSFDRVSKLHTTIKSIWAKQVRHVCGMSEEQCVYFMDLYPTPAVFFDDLEDRLIGEQEAGVNEAQSAKKARKMQHGDPRNHVKNRLEPNGAYKPRPMCGPTTARLWHLATADDYAGCEVQA